jgi:DnaK suppressor protein
VKTSNKANSLGKSVAAKKATAPVAKAKVTIAKAADKPVAKTKLTPAKAKPTAAKAKPTAAKAKPTAAKAKPTAAKAKPTTAKAKPTTAKAKPTIAKAMPTQKTATPVKAATVKTSAVSTAASKPTGKASPARSTAAPKVATTAQAVQTPKAKNMSVTKVETVTPPVESKPANTPPASEQLVRATRPSARLAQITVPSLPPAVASTAAKSSFLPSAAPAAVAVPFAPIKKDPKLANNWKTKKVEELSDAEILAMSDDQYMNDKQMAYFRLKLTRLKQDILASAGQTTEHLREDTVVVPDPADRATIEEEHALELRTRDRERKLLKKIEQSIQRIDAGDYGFCDETGEAIGVGRLLARPTATLSLEAQQRRELKQKMFGD